MRIIIRPIKLQPIPNPIIIRPTRSGPYPATNAPIITEMPPPAATYPSMVRIKFIFLEEKFGNEFLDYKKRVPRWFPKIKK